MEDISVSGNATSIDAHWNGMIAMPPSQMRFAVMYP
jgi:hypothetical protein